MLKHPLRAASGRNWRALESSAEQSRRLRYQRQTHGSPGELPPCLRQNGAEWHGRAGGRTFKSHQLAKSPTAGDAVQRGHFRNEGASSHQIIWIVGAVGRLARGVTGHGKEFAEAV